MAYEGSYLSKLRQKVGHELVLMPGSAVLVEDEQGRILMTQRTDTGQWCIPGGGAEPGQDFVATAISELEEEVGLTAERQDLTAFGCSSDPKIGTTHFPNGDVTQYFVMCYITHRWRKISDQFDISEVKAMDFFPAEALPKDLTSFTRHALDLYKRFQASGQFQAD